MAQAAPADESEPNDTKATADTIAIGPQDYTRARMNTATDVDAFTFNAVEGVDYVIETFNVGNATGALYIDLYDSADNKIDTPARIARRA